MKHFVVFMGKVVCDVIFRLLIFGAWMFTVNCWMFSADLTVAYFYGMMTLMVVINVRFLKENEKIASLRNMFGNLLINLN